MINETIAEGKKRMDKCFIKVKVDIDNLKLSASARTDQGWTNLELDQNIPLDILEKYVSPLASDLMSDSTEASQPLSWSGTAQGGGRRRRHPVLYPD